jgi:hypothetical protein
MFNKRDYKFFIFLLFILVASTLFLTGCVNREEVVEENEKVKESVDNSKEEIVTGDFSKFSSERQEIGTLGDENYDISFFAEKPMNGYHNFVFELEGADVLPYVSAQYRPELGSVRLTFQNIEEDGSGIGYQRSYDIDEKGVVRVFHNVSPNENEEVYDIGVAKSTDFSLYGEELENGKWKISLDVRYPGESNIQIDFGSDEFGVEDQEIDGATASDGARITTYSYTIEGNVFQFIWTVRGSDDQPIPKVRARYNQEGELVVTFPSLDSDTIGRDAGEMNLIGGLEKVVWSRTGEETIYRFVVGSEKNYRLKASPSPNQVVLEIEL